MVMYAMIDSDKIYNYFDGKFNENFLRNFMEFPQKWPRN